MRKTAAVRVVPLDATLNSIHRYPEQPLGIGGGVEAASGGRHLLGGGKMNEAIFGI